MDDTYEGIARAVAMVRAYEAAGRFDVPAPMPLPVWDVCPECGQAPGYPCREGNTAVDYLHESRRTVPTSEASRIARAHERWLPATD
jgi:hypothetical protein